MKSKIYKTFWRRLIAGVIDVFLLFCMSFITSNLALSDGNVFTQLQAVVDNGLWLGYSIYLHGRYGQTLGKRLLKVKVVTTCGKSITYFEAFKRDIVYLALAVITIVTFLTHKGVYAQYNESLTFLNSYEFTEDAYNDKEVIKHMVTAIEAAHSPVMWVGYTSTVYLLLEIITMLTNRKRRSVHDFIAGTGVRRLE